MLSVKQSESKTHTCKKRIYKGDLEEMVELQSGLADWETWWESSRIGTRELICLGRAQELE